jgi:hypothetical protein
MWKNSLGCLSKKRGNFESIESDEFPGHGDSELIHGVERFDKIMLMDDRMDPVLELSRD